MVKLAQRLGLSRYQADERYHAALAACRGRDWKTATAEIDKAIDLLPSHAEYQATKGFFHLQDGAIEAARTAFERALGLNPYEMLANYGLGVIAYRGKDWRRAAAYFSDALAAMPDRAETRYYLAMIHHRLGSNAEAMQWMESAASLFASADDRRVQHCAAWSREFERLTSV